MNQKLNNIRKVVKQSEMSSHLKMLLGTDKIETRVLNGNVLNGITTITMSDEERIKQIYKIINRSRI